MKENPDLISHAEGVWSLEFPLRFMGLNLGRRATLLAISEKRLVIHSTGPFTAGHRRRMEQLGRPEILLDATTMHDTFACKARAVFSDVAYFVPESFPVKARGPTARAFSDLESTTAGEIQTVRLDGMRFFEEYACFHPVSRTLIVCDLLFNLDRARGYTRWAMRHLLGVKEWPAMDRPVRMAVKDRDAFTASIKQILEWDFDRVIVAHGSVIEKNGKDQFRDAMLRAGFSL